MTSSGIGQANANQKEEIAQLWQACFGERREAIDYFLERVFAPEHCLVHVEDSRVVAMVHMLPARMVHEEATVQVHYIYAAATDPGFRSRGLMGALLEQAFSYGETRGDACSFLLPSEPSLYDYYGRHGYVPYFRTRFAEVCVDELGLPAPEAEGFTASSVDNLPQLESARRLRDSQLAEDVGSIIWPFSYLDYAAKVNSIYSGQTLALWDREGVLRGYALHSPVAEGSVEISEVISGKGSWREMLRYVSRTTGANRLRLRLAENSPILSGLGEVKSFGMARPLGNFMLPGVIPGRSPYIGLTLD